MTISVIISTYGDHVWKTMAEERALRSLTGFTDEDSFVLYHMDGGTRSLSLNVAAEKAPGEWLCFLDADDELAPGYVGAMRRALEQQTDGTSVLLTPAVQTIRRGRPGPATFFKAHGTLRDMNWLVIGTLIHRDLFWEVGGFDEYPHGFEDWALWSKCYRAGATVVKVKDAVYRYHLNPQSAHRRGWRDRKWQTETHLRVQADLDAWEAARA